MTQLNTATKQEGFGATSRRDAWWVGPGLTFLGLMAFVVYGTWAALQGSNFEIRKNTENFHQANNPVVAPYLAPFYAPLLYDKQSPHAWFHADIQYISPAFLILAFPGLFRFTCYYYRKAYYRSFWADPPACGVGEPRKGYWGENRFPLILQNSHRYWMYFAIIFLVLLTWDALLAFRWPELNEAGTEVDHHTFGIGLGTIIMVINIVLLAGFTFGCNSVRHLVGGRMDCFSCPNNTENLRPRYKVWRWSTILNERHMEWAWLSLFSVGFTDFYIRMCAMGVWTDWRII